MRKTTPSILVSRSGPIQSLWVREPAGRRFGVPGRALGAPGCLGTRLGGREGPPSCAEGPTSGEPAAGAPLLAASWVAAQMFAVFLVCCFCGSHGKCVTGGRAAQPQRGRAGVRRGGVEHPPNTGSEGRGWGRLPGRAGVRCCWNHPISHMRTLRPGSDLGPHLPPCTAQREPLFCTESTGLSAFSAHGGSQFVWGTGEQ